MTFASTPPPPLLLRPHPGPCHLPEFLSVGPLRLQNSCPTHHLLFLQLFLSFASPTPLFFSSLGSLASLHLLPHISVPSSLHSLPATIPDYLPKHSFITAFHFPVLLFVEPSPPPPPRKSQGGICPAACPRTPAPGSGHSYQNPVGSPGQNRSLQPQQSWHCCLTDFLHASQFSLNPSACQSLLFYSSEGSMFTSEEGIRADTSKKKQHQLPEPHTYQCAFTHAMFVLCALVLEDSSSSFYLKLIPPEPRTPLCGSLVHAESLSPASTTSPTLLALSCQHLHVLELYSSEAGTDKPKLSYLSQRTTLFFFPSWPSFFKESFTGPVSPLLVPIRSSSQCHPASPPARVSACFRAAIPGDPIVLIWAGPSPPSDAVPS